MSENRGVHMFEFKMLHLVISLIALFISSTAATLSGTWFLINVSVKNLRSNFDLYITHQESIIYELRKNTVSLSKHVHEHEKKLAHEGQLQFDQMISEQLKTLNEEVLRIERKIDRVERRIIQVLEKKE